MSDTATIAQIQANIATDIEEQRKSEEDKAALDFLGTDDKTEEEQLDAAVATLDPIAQLRKQKADEDREKREKKQEAYETGTIINTTTSAIKDAQEQAFQTAEKIRDAGRGAWDGIGRISIPGSIWLPVAILLLFFFLLLPVNGHTRAQWLWLALTGNANIEGGGSGAGGSPTMTRPFTGVSVV